MLTTELLENWLFDNDHTKNWLARECGIDVRTVRNWFSSGAIPQKQQKRIAELMAMESETLHTIPVKLRHENFTKAKKKALASDMPLDEYCARVIIDSL